MKPFKSNYQYLSFPLPTTPENLFIVLILLESRYIATINLRSDPYYAFYKSPIEINKNLLCGYRQHIFISVTLFRVSVYIANISVAFA